MKPIHTIVALLLTHATMLAAEVKADPDIPRLVGRWKAVSGSLSGASESALHSVYYIFSQTNVTVSDGIIELKFTYKIDSTKTPKEMDQAMTVEGQTIATKAIYSLDKDKLTVCASAELDGPRPTSLRTKKGDGLVVMIFQRATEDSKPKFPPQVEKSIQALKALGARFEVNPQGEVTSVLLNNENITTSDLNHLKAFDKLDSLSISLCQITSEGAAIIGKLSLLERIVLNLTRIDDTGLAALNELTKLKEITLVGEAKVTKKGVLQLKGLPRLREVGLIGASVSKDDLAELKKAMPKCKFVE